VKQIYLEGWKGLIPVHQVRINSNQKGYWLARIMETGNGYHRHEMITMHNRYFVYKTISGSGYFTSPAALPQ
jgi:hypothetical protein